MKKNVVLYSSNKKSHGALAQLGAHDTGSVGVTGSSPVCSITKRDTFTVSLFVMLNLIYGARSSAKNASGKRF